jgi:hypothetical protein
LPASSSWVRWSALALLAGAASGMVAVTITTRTLVEMLRWFGISG